MEVMISCRNLTRRFGDFIAVDNLNLEVETGAICAFLGPNGAGKSTTVKMMTGLLAPTSGEVRVCGLDPTAAGLELKRRIGVLPEDLGLFDDLTVEEHLLLTGDIYGVSRADHEVAHGTACCTLSAWSMDAALSPRRAPTGCARRPRSRWRCCPTPRCSSWMSRSRPWIRSPRRSCATCCNRWRATGVTVFLTSHILSMVERIATQIVMIRKGKVVWNSTVGELPQSLEDHYFDLVETPVVEELEWLGPSRS